jgi:hypothetical protein
MYWGMCGLIALPSSSNSGAIKPFFLASSNSNSRLRSSLVFRPPAPDDIFVVCFARFDFLSSSKLFRKSTLTKLILSALRVRVCEKERDIERERERESCSCLAQKASLFFSLFKEEEE